MWLLLWRNLIYRLREWRAEPLSAGNVVDRFARILTSLTP